MISALLNQKIKSDLPCIRECVSYLTQLKPSSAGTRDSEVKQGCDARSDGMFRQLFLPVAGDRRHRAARGKLPEGAPRNLRRLFSRAVVLKDGPPRLRIEKAAESA